MDKTAVRAFFDDYADRWDAQMVRNEEVIHTILTHAGITPGVTVLDVACGTGVLIPDYLARGAKVTAIDLSPKMVAIAQDKFPEVDILCGDAEEWQFQCTFDVVMVYNAWPHFCDPARMISRLATLLNVGGILSIAHGMSREALTKHHEGKAGRVSSLLPAGEELAKMIAPWFEVVLIQEDEKMYQVVGKKR